MADEMLSSVLETESRMQRGFTRFRTSCIYSYQCNIPLVQHPIHATWKGRIPENQEQCSTEQLDKNDGVQISEVTNGTC